MRYCLLMHYQEASEIDGPDAGLAALGTIADAALQRFQPALWTRAHLLARAGRTDDARAAYRRAIELTADPAVAEYPRRRLAVLPR